METDNSFEQHTQDEGITMQTIQSMLSSVRQARETFEAAVSCIPTHPFEKLKYQFLSPEQQQLSIENIAVPIDFCPFNVTHQLTSISYTLQEATLQQMNSVMLSGAGEACNSFASLSENVFVVNKEKVANYLQYIEMVNNISVESIENNPMEVAKRVLAQYVTFFGK
jgi:hypothetical protein